MNACIVMAYGMIGDLLLRAMNYQDDGRARGTLRRFFARVLSSKPARDAPAKVLWGDQTKRTTVGAFRWVIAFELEAPIVQHRYDTLDQLDIRAERVTCYHDVTQPRRIMPVGVRVDQHVVAGFQGGQHRRPRYPEPAAAA